MTTETDNTNTAISTANPTEYLEFAKANDREGANAYIEKHFGALGTENHDEKGLEAFTKEVLDQVEKEAIEAATATDTATDTPETGTTEETPTNEVSESK